MKPHLLSAVVYARTMHKLVHGRHRPLRKKPAPQRPPKHIELAYTAFILNYLKPVREAVRTRLWPKLKREVDRIQASLKVDALGDIEDDIDVLRLEFEGPVVSNYLQAKIRDFGQRTAEYQGSELQKQIKTSLGVELPLHDPHFAARLHDFTTENIALIKSVPEKYLDAVQATVMSGATAGLRWEEIAAKLDQQDGVVKGRAALIARDQVGKFYGAVQQARQQSLGITSFVWETAGDERVREEHQLLDGKTFSWNDLPDEGAPGMPINCRCTATPNFEQAIAELSGEEPDEEKRAAEE